MTRRLVLGAVLAAFALPGVVALADHDEVGPIYKHVRQTAICTVRCDDGPCDFSINIYDENANIVASGDFTDIPNHAARAVFYSGTKRLLTCEAPDPVGAGDAEDAGFVLLSPTGQMVAMTSQDE